MNEAVQTPCSLLEMSEKKSPVNFYAFRKDHQQILLRVSWLAVLLGFVIEGLMLLITGLEAFSGARMLLANLMQKISWSLFVCLGLAFGRAAAKTFTAPLTGLAGVLIAPAAFILARSLHRAAGQLLTIPISNAVRPSLLVMALLKGVEYGGLGMLLGWLSHRAANGRGGGGRAHFMAGLLTGLVSGSVLLALIWQDAAPPPATEILARGINEILFPVGCSLTLYAAKSPGKGLSR